ncbi:hypothetical protein G9E11_13940 [Arthrobacter sp. IA7]|nr:hypothetical protein [Arthrobacter ipis]
MSLVPNVAIAKSFSHGGVKSMNVEPRANRGVARAVKNAPASSATESTTAAAATPARAANAAGPLNHLMSFFMTLVRSGGLPGLSAGLNWVPVTA